MKFLRHKNKKTKNKKNKNKKDKNKKIKYDQYDQITALLIGCLETLGYGGEYETESESEEEDD